MFCSKVRLGIERSESTYNPSVSAYLCFWLSKSELDQGNGENINWSTVCETNSRSTHRWGQNYLSGDAEYSIEKQTDFLLPEAVSLNISDNKWCYSTCPLSTSDTEGNFSQSSCVRSIRFREAQVSLSALKPEETYTLYLECFITYISKCSLPTPLFEMASWYWICYLNDMCFFLCQCQWHQIYNLQH